MSEEENDSKKEYEEKSVDKSRKKPDVGPIGSLISHFGEIGLELSQQLQNVSSDIRKFLKKINLKN